MCVRPSIRTSAEKKLTRIEETTGSRSIISEATTNMAVNMPTNCQPNRERHDLRFQGQPFRMQATGVTADATARSREDTILPSGELMERVLPNILAFMLSQKLSQIIHVLADIQVMYNLSNLSVFTPFLRRGNGVYRQLIISFVCSFVRSFGRSFIRSFGRSFVRSCGFPSVRSSRNVRHSRSKHSEGLGWH